MLPVQVNKLLRDKIKLLYLQQSEENLEWKGRKMLRQCVSQLGNVRQELQPVGKVINIKKKCSWEKSMACFAKKY